MDLIQYWWVLLIIVALIMYKFILRVFFGYGHRAGRQDRAGDQKFCSDRQEP
jgi:hypothetical protein